MGRVAKVTKTIDDALALYAKGKSQRECEKLTGIPKSTIDRVSKKRGIVKGQMGQIIADKVRVESEIGALPPHQAELVTNEVDKILSGMDFYQSEARAVVKAGVKSYKKAPDPNTMKSVVDGMKSAMQVEGLQPFFQSAGSTNIQNNIENNVITQISRVIVDQR